MTAKHGKAVLLIWVLVVCLWCPFRADGQVTEAQDRSVSNPVQTRSVTDMLGRKVIVSSKINRIATIGAVPVINGYLFALGKGEKIINGLPYFTPSKWRIQIVIAPHLAGLPVLQGQNCAVNTEMLLRLKLDVVITMDKSVIKALENSGIPVLFLEWKDVADVKASMKLLGVVLDRTPKSNEYFHYFEITMNGVHQALHGIAKGSAPKILFFDPSKLRFPLPIAEWWINEAGGQSVTASISRDKTGCYSHELVLLWNPDIMIVASPEQITKVYEDKRLSRVKAVLNKKVYVMPVGTHPWGQRTVEQPLTVLWAAKLFFPDRFRHVDMKDEVCTFYRRFFNHKLSDKDVRWILNGGTE